MRVMRWRKVPSAWMVDAGIFPKLIGGKDELGTLGAKICALMVYIALAMSSEEEELGASRILSSSMTYDEIQSLTGLSRPSITKGINVLESIGLIKQQISGRSANYIFCGYDFSQGWCKLPVKALIEKSSSGLKIKPFFHFTKRGLIELHALKLYLYLLAIRGNNNLHSAVSYEKIAEQTAIPRKNIRKAGSYLLSCGLLSDIRKPQGSGDYESNANMYFSSGSADLYSRF